MTLHSVTPLNEEIMFGENEIIVSKTDLKGRLTYANDVFCRVAEMAPKDVIGQPHNIIRHPDMPRTIFKLLWDSIQDSQEIFAYVKNMSRTGKYYWVLAHVTPSMDLNGKLDGFHSNRRKPGAKEIDKISHLYQDLLKEEQRHPNGKMGLEAGHSMLHDIISGADQTYPEFIWSMQN